MYDPTLVKNGIGLQRHV